MSLVSNESCLSYWISTLFFVKFDPLPSTLKDGYGTMTSMQGPASMALTSDNTRKYDGISVPTSTTAASASSLLTTRELQEGAGLGPTSLDARHHGLFHLLPVANMRQVEVSIVPN